MANVVVLLIVAAIVAAAVRYIIREKKRGVKCIGCPHAGTCAARQQGGCGTEKE